MRMILNVRLEGKIFPNLTCHYLTMSLRATDLRDFLFAKFGLSSNDTIIKLSYTDSVGKVYTDFVPEHIKKTKSLDIIRFDARNTQVPNIPSWVPDWSAGFAADPLQPDHAGNPRIDFPYYTASLGEPVSSTVDIGPSETNILVN
jgi:hypothetical protein